MQQIPFKPWAVDEDWGFEFQGGTFAGVTVQIKKLELVKDSNGNCELEFHIINKPEGFDTEKFKTQEFSESMQAVVQEIIKVASASSKNNEAIVEGNIDEVRDDNPPEPDPQ